MKHVQDEPLIRAVQSIFQSRVSPKLVRDLVPNPRNARKHSKKQVRQIAESIRRFGFTNPIIVDEVNRIVAGHGRWMAARLLGLESVPVIQVSGLSENDLRAYALADNKIAENSNWDFDIVGGELTALLEANIDISITGFSIAEIDMILDGGEGVAPVGDEDDAIPTVQSKQVTRLGDRWQLGKHRLICGDARDEKAYARLMSGRGRVRDRADMVFTDPPYNVKIDGNVSGRGRHSEFVMASGEMSDADFTDFLHSSLSGAARWSADGSIHFVFMDWRHMQNILEAGHRVYSALKNLIIWAKDSAGMGTFYRSQHELIFAFKNGDAPHHNSFGLGEGGRHRSNVWRYRGANTPSKQSREELALHPTVKPVAMVADAIKDCCPRDGIVLDPFCGSGTIFIAAEKTGRRGRAIELDPIYCDTAIRRWQAFAHDDAILIETGETFAEVEARLRNAPPTIPEAAE